LTKKIFLVAVKNMLIIAISLFFFFFFLKKSKLLLNTVILTSMLGRVIQPFGSLRAYNFFCFSLLYLTLNFSWKAFFFFFYNWIMKTETHNLMLCNFQVEVAKNRLSSWDDERQPLLQNWMDFGKSELVIFRLWTH
jgi:hypothetical protein